LGAHDEPPLLEIDRRKHANAMKRAKEWLSGEVKPPSGRWQSF
jgi:hypothetical protein